MTHRRFKCSFCGAPLNNADDGCEYCGVGWKPPDASLKSPVAAPPNANQSEYFVFFALMFTCFPAAIVYMWAETHWRSTHKWLITTLFFIIPLIFVVVILASLDCAGEIESPTPVDSPAPEAPAARQTLSLQPAQVFAAMKDIGNTKRQRVDLWHNSFAGRWIQWRVRLDRIYRTANGLTAVRLKADTTDIFTIVAHVASIDDTTLAKLKDGAEITVTGRLWGFNTFMNEIKLANAEISAGP